MWDSSEGATLAILLTACLCADSSDLESLSLLYLVAAEILIVFGRTWSLWRHSHQRCSLSPY